MIELTRPKGDGPEKPDRRRFFGKVGALMAAATLGGVSLNAEAMEGKTPKTSQRPDKLESTKESELAKEYNLAETEKAILGKYGTKWRQRVDGLLQESAKKRMDAITALFGLPVAGAMVGGGLGGTLGALDSKENQEHKAAVGAVAGMALGALATGVATDGGRLLSGGTIDFLRTVKERISAYMDKARKEGRLTSSPESVGQVISERISELKTKQEEIRKELDKM